MTQAAAAVPTPAVRVSGLTKTYGVGDALVRALDDVTLDLFAGEFTAIMGASGSGKSTLMHICAALDNADAGTVMVGDWELGRPQRQAAHRAAPRRDRLRLPVLQPGADPHRGREHRRCPSRSRVAAPSGRGTTR